MEGETGSREGEGMHLERHIWAAQCWCFFLAFLCYKKREVGRRETDANLPEEN